MRKNPSLAGKKISMPIVTGGVTHALSLVGDLFVNKGEMVLLPDSSGRITSCSLASASKRRWRSIRFSTPRAGSTSRRSARRWPLAPRSWKTILILNFPTNPTGYIPATTTEIDQIVTCSTRRPKMAAIWSW